MGDEAGMAVWALKHREYVKELIINQEEQAAHDFNRDWLVVSMLAHWGCSVSAVSTRCSLAHCSARLSIEAGDVPAVSTLYSLASYSAMTKAFLC